MTKEQFDALCRMLAELQRSAGTGVVVVTTERGTAQALEAAGLRVIPVGELAGELTPVPNGQAGMRNPFDESFAILPKNEPGAPRFHIKK